MPANIGSGHQRTSSMIELVISMGIFALGIGRFEITIWSVLSGLLSVGMAASRIR